jgi:hypothetical protein
MAFLIGVLGILQMLGGILVTVASKSAIHEILGAVSFGLGTLALGLGAVLRQLADVETLKAAVQTLLVSRKA